MSTETWRPIPGWDGYEVSDQGRVKSNRRGSINRILKPEVRRGGYHRINLHGTGAGGAHVQHPAAVHALVLLAFVGPKPDGMVRRHLDGNPQNNALSNLAYGTYAENNLDAVRHGTHAMARKTHCKRGHPFDATNTAPRKGKSGRLCLTCRRIYAERQATKLVKQGQESPC